jgi:MFS family permease
MYQIGGWLNLLTNRRAGAADGTSRIGANVFFLGFTSLFTDISSEMVVSILPVYVVTFLRLSPTQFGVIDGLYNGVAAVVQLASGLIADRSRRYKEVAAAGYAASAICKLALLTTTAWTGIAGVLVVDRLGKGLRTAPRDALISLSAATERLGTAFGIHRAMDALGAMLGPLLAFALLTIVPGGFDVVFVTSFCVALIGLAVLGFFVENRQPLLADSVAGAAATVGEALGLLQRPEFRHLTVCALLFGLTTISDAFVYLVLQRRLNFAAGSFPLLYLLTSLGYLLLAVPAGRLADRVGRFRVFVGGYVLLIALDGLLIWAQPGFTVLVAVLLLLGAHYAATEGVLMALGSAVLPTERRTSGLAILTTATALARLTASVVFGVIWAHFGQRTTVATFLAGLSAALLIAWATVPRRNQPEQRHA